MLGITGGRNHSFQPTKRVIYQITNLFYFAIKKE